MKKLGFLVPLCLILVAIPILSACGAGQSSGSASKDPYKVGVTFPQTGPQAVQGNVVIPAIEIAVADINKDGGVDGHPLQLVIEDSKGTPDGGVAAMRKLVQIDKVAVIETIYTNVATGQIPVAEEAKVPLVSSVESPGLTSRSEWLFAHSALLDRTLPPLMKVWEQRKVKKLFAFFPDTALYQFGAPLVKETWTKAGGEYDEARFKLGETDFRGIVSRAKAFNPDAILLWGHGSLDEPSIMKQVREMGMSTPFYLGYSAMTTKNYREALGSAGEGLIYAGYKFDKQAAKKFMDAYQAKMGFEPDFLSLEWYDITRMVAEAIKKGGYNGPGIRKALTEIKDFPTSGGGKVTMGPDRQSRVDVATYEFKGGQIVELK